MNEIKTLVISVIVIIGLVIAGKLCLTVIEHDDNHAQLASNISNELDMELNENNSSSAFIDVYVYENKKELNIVLLDNNLDFKGKSLKTVDRKYYNNLRKELSRKYNYKVALTVYDKNNILIYEK